MKNNVCTYRGLWIRSWRYAGNLWSYFWCGYNTQYENSCANPQEPTSKAATYKIMRKLTSRFREKNGSELCHELKGSNNNGVPLRECRGCVEDAATILEEILAE